MWIAAVSFFKSSLAQLRLNEDLEGLECENYCWSCERLYTLESFYRKEWHQAAYSL